MEILTIEEAAIKLKRTPRSIRALILRRAIPFRKAGGRILFIEEELDRWVLASPGKTLEDLDDKCQDIVDRKMCHDIVDNGTPLKVL